MVYYRNNDLRTVFDNREPDYNGLHYGPRLACIRPVAYFETAGQLLVVFAATLTIS